MRKLFCFINYITDNIEESLIKNSSHNLIGSIIIAAILNYFSRTQQIVLETPQKYLGENPWQPSTSRICSIFIYTDIN